MKAELVASKSPLWGETLAKVPHDVFHSPGFAAAFARHEGGEALAFVASSGNQALFIPLIVRPVTQSLFDATSPYGYSGPLLYRDGADENDGAVFVHDALDRLLSLLDSCGIVSVFLRLHPHLTPSAAVIGDIGTIVHHGEIVAIDLSLTEEQLRSEIRSSFRNRINRSFRNSDHFTIGEGEADVEEFLDIYRENMDRVGAESYYYFSDEIVQQLFAELAGSIFVSFLSVNGRRVCASVVTEKGGLVNSFLSGTRSEFLSLSPLVALNHRLTLWAKSRGDRYFDLGGGLGGNADSLFHFKAGFSNLRFPYLTWRIVVSSEKYQTLVENWERENQRPAPAIDGFFPAYRARNPAA